MDCLTQRHLLIVGQTGSGKTTSTLSILERLQKSGHANIVLDPTGEYARLPHAIVYQLGVNAYLEAGKFNTAQLCEALNLSFDHDLLEKVTNAIIDLRIQQNLLNQSGCYQRINVPIVQHQHELESLGSWSNNYSIKDLPNQLIEEFIVPYPDNRANYHLLGQTYDRQTINQNWYQLTTLRERLANPAIRQLFGTTEQPNHIKTELNFVLQMFLNQRSVHHTLVIDLSALKSMLAGQRAVISLLMKQVLEYRLQHPANFPVNLVIDEAHRYLPNNEADLSDNGIFQMLREGRKVRLNVILTTQSPLDLPAKLRSQFPNLLIHHLASPEEINGLNLPTTLIEPISRLNVGQAYQILPTNDPQLINVPLPSFKEN